MKRTLSLGLALGLLLAAAASAQTKNGSASTTKTPTYDLDASGQVLFTLMWPKKTTDLDMGVFCPDDQGLPTLVALGISSSDRVERMEMGVGNTVNCFVGVAAFKGSSKFTLNVFSSAGLGFARSPAKVLDADEPEAPERVAAIEQILAAKRRSLEKQARELHAGAPRAGDLSAHRRGYAAEIATPCQVVTVDASNVETGLGLLEKWIGHSYYASSATVLDDLRQLFVLGADAAGRRLLRKRNLEHSSYWLIP